ncbi:MAG: RnfH family protein [Xanthomonadales bacterium]|nr:RnfH family protein [Xanthomonadales bacterium]MBP7623226.1 RnfH family protein [Xanthomonadales bacterium]
MRIEVVYATADVQHCVVLNLRDGASVADAIAASGLPLGDIDDEQVGVWNRRVTLATLLREADRVEVYRPLVADPKQARRQRAERNPVGVQAKRKFSRS